MGKSLAEEVQDKAIKVSALAQWCHSMREHTPAFAQIEEHLTRSSEWLATISAAMQGVKVKLPDPSCHDASSDKLRELLQAICTEVNFFKAEGLTLDSPVEVIGRAHV